MLAWLSLITDPEAKARSAFKLNLSPWGEEDDKEDDKIELISDLDAGFDRDSCARRSASCQSSLALDGQLR